MQLEYKSCNRKHAIEIQSNIEIMYNDKNVEKYFDNMGGNV